MERRGGPLWADPQPILPWEGRQGNGFIPLKFGPFPDILYIPRHRATLKDGCAEGAKDDGQ